MFICCVIIEVLLLRPVSVPPVWEGTEVAITEIAIFSKEKLGQEDKDTWVAYQGID